MSDGIAIIKMKIMPSSPEVDLEGLKDKIKEVVSKEGGNNEKFSEQPIAFGLKAVIVEFTWPEEKELEGIEESLGEIEGVQSVQVSEMSKIA